MAGGVLLEGGKAQVRLVGRLVGLAPGFVGIKRLDDPGGQEAGHDPPQTADGAEDDGAGGIAAVVDANDRCSPPTTATRPWT